MKKIPVYILPLILVVFLAGCTTKENTSLSIDYETINKDENFRTSITTGNFVELGNGYTYYEFENRAADTLVVMVHGFSVPSYIWDSTYHAVIKRGYGVLRYDTYGRGYSDSPDVVYDVSLFSSQLKELLDSLTITKPITLMGLSDGGRTITVFAAHYPQQIKNLVYVDAAGFNTMTDSVSSPALVSEEEITAFKQSDGYATMASGQLGDFYDSIPFRGWDKRYRAMMQYKGFVRALISTNKNRTDLEKEHRQVAQSGIPVFAIWGEHDTVVKLEDVRANLLARIPKVNLIVIPNAGHLPHMEQTNMFNTIFFNEIMGAKK